MNEARILVVDDEPDITALVAYHLARAGYRVKTAATGPEALEAVRPEPPDLIVLDLMLPGRSGLEVLAELRRREETRGHRRHPAHRAARGGGPRARASPRAPTTTSPSPSAPKSWCCA